MEIFFFSGPLAGVPGCLGGQAPNRATSLVFGDRDRSDGVMTGSFCPRRNLCIC